MAVIRKPPEKLDDLDGLIKIFLAGSIELGDADDWQQRATSALMDLGDIALLNPRRDDWDASWEMRMDHPRFYEQVTWELAGLEMADIILMFFDPKTKSPITMIELGLWAKSGKMVVCCPNGFWRKGNVDIVCQRYGVQTATTPAALIMAIRERVLYRRK